MKIVNTMTLDSSGLVDSTSTHIDSGYSYKKSITLIIIAYIACISLGVVTTYFLVNTDSLDVLYASMIGDVIATLVIFIFSFIYSNTSFYGKFYVISISILCVLFAYILIYNVFDKYITIIDAYWSVIPAVLAIYWFIYGNIFNARTYVSLAICLLWAIRLTVNWLIGWTGLGHEDWRYVQFQNQMGRAAYWVFSFLNLHYFPTTQKHCDCREIM